MKNTVALCLIGSGALGGLLFACSGSSSGGSNVDMMTNPDLPGATYTVGGVVSGLSASGLVLTLNGGRDLPVAAAGPFTFAGGVAAGANYAVAVKTQPSNQTCTVSSGSGTVSGANVTSVAVACSTNTFAVGGTISGLSGSVVLQNNAGDDLTVSASGQFSFATSLAVGASYAVTVKTQPAMQLCTVSAGSGSIGNGPVTSVVVSCATPLSCQDALTKLPTAADGAYFINPDNTTPYQTWCDMTTDGGGWTLAMRVKTDGTFGYASTYWTDAKLLNEDAGGSVDPALNANAKTAAFLNLPGTTIRGCKGVPGPNLCFQQSLGANPATLTQVFNGKFITGGPSRAALVALWGDDGTQPNCNASGLNNVSGSGGAGTYSGARFGLVGNNENDCATTDSGWGFGVYGCSATTNACGAGAQFWQGGTCGRNCTQGTIWVR